MEFSELRTVRGIFHIVTQAGDRLHDHLGARHMVDRDAARILSAQPLDPEAARLYSLGVSTLRNYDLLAARDLLEQAVQVDPKFSLAHVMLARAWSDLGYGQNRTLEATKALDLSSDLPEQLRMTVQAEYYACTGQVFLSVATRNGAADALRPLRDGEGARGDRFTLCLRQQ